MRQGRSYYYSMFKQGATIVPRVFYFVEPKVDPFLGLNVTSPYVESARDAVRLAKKEYQGLRFKGRIHRDFLYATLLGSDVVPFAHLPFRIVFLPLIVEGANYRLLTAIEVESMGYSDTADWLKQAEKRWAERRGEKAANMSVYEWLDYAGKLTSQNPSAVARLIYNSSGTDIAATVVTGPYLHNVDGHELSLTAFVAECTTYVCELADQNEAHYLSAIVNSPFLNEMKKKMQSLGLLGERHIHKKPLEFAIPRYDRQNSVHRELSELGFKCSEKANAVLKSLLEEYGSLAKIRGSVRKELSPELSRIDELVRELLVLDEK